MVSWWLTTGCCGPLKDITLAGPVVMGWPASSLLAPLTRWWMTINLRERGMAKASVFLEGRWGPEQIFVYVQLKVYQVSQNLVVEHLPKHIQKLEQIWHFSSPLFWDVFREICSRGQRCGGCSERWTTLRRDACGKRNNMPNARELALPYISSQYTMPSKTCECIHEIHHITNETWSFLVNFVDCSP